MEHVWKRIEAWLEQNAPEVKAALQEGATKEALDAAEQSLGVKLPEDVRASYLIHDGQNEDLAPLVGEWVLLPLEAVVAEAGNLRGLLADGSFGAAQGKPTGPVRPDWYNPHWIPVAYNGGGDFHCVDLAPPSGGTPGQLVTFFHADERRPLQAGSFREWLENFAKDLEQGRYTWDGEVLTQGAEDASG